jgi:hypothetical protein
MQKVDIVQMVMQIGSNGAHHSANGCANGANWVLNFMEPLFDN